MGHGCFNLVDRDGGLRIEGPRLENGVYQIGVPIDEPVAEFPVVQHVVEQVAVHVGRVGIAGVFDVILVNIRAKKSEPRIGIVQQVFPFVLLRCPENLDVVQSPGDAHPIGVLDVCLEHEIVDVVLHINQRREEREETLA